MLDGITREQHLKALTYLGKICGDKNVKYAPLPNNELMGMMVDKCSKILGMKGTWVYNFPLTPQHDVYNGQQNCFEIYESNLEPNIYMLTVNDIRFDSRNYDSSISGRLAGLYVKTKEICAAPVREIEKSMHR